MRRPLWALGAVAALVLVVMLTVGGWQPVVLLSDSMAPAAPAGSLLLAREVDPVDVTVDDVVTVPLPSGEGRVTHRVVEVDRDDGVTWVRLQGDANAVPDAGRVALAGPTLRTVAVVPVLGRVVGGGSPVLLAGIALLLVGTLGLLFVERRSAARTPVTRHEPRLPTGTSGLDTRSLALFATLEALAEDGMDAATLRSLAQARVGALFGLGTVEESDQVAALDDGARFVVLSLADADPDALAVVPAASRRATEARAAVEGWWLGVESRVPSAVLQELEDVLAVVGEQGGIEGERPVD